MSVFSDLMYRMMNAGSHSELKNVIECFDQAANKYSLIELRGSDTNETLEDLRTLIDNERLFRAQVLASTGFNNLPYKLDRANDSESFQSVIEHLEECMRLVNSLPAEYTDTCTNWINYSSSIVKKRKEYLEECDAYFTELTNFLTQAQNTFDSVTLRELSSNTLIWVYKNQPFINSLPINLANLVYKRHADVYCTIESKSRAMTFIENDWCYFGEALTAYLVNIDDLLADLAPVAKSTDKPSALYQAMTNQYNNAKKLRDSFANQELSLTSFQAAINDLCGDNEDMKVINTHRGSKLILLNLLVAFCTGFIFYAIALGIKEAIEPTPKAAPPLNRFTLFGEGVVHTESRQRMEKFRDIVAIDPYCNEILSAAKAIAG